MIVKLPYPDSALMPNKKNGKHWGVTNNVKKTANTTAYVLTKIAVNKNNPQIIQNKKIAVSINYVQTDNRHRDLDNLLAASKAYLDGMAKGLGIDDRLFRPITIDSSIGSVKEMIVSFEL